MRRLFLGLFGGSLYYLTELACRGKSHWTMFLLGGICFVLIGEINEKLSWDMSIICQSIIGSLIITSSEFIVGYIVNIVLEWNVWDYSDHWGNIMGQICPMFSVIWIFVSFLVIILDDFIRWKFFGEEKPHYKII